MIVRIWYEPILNKDDREPVDIAIKLTFMRIEEILGYNPPYNLHGKRKKILNFGCMSKLDGNKVYDQLKKEECQGIIKKVKLIEKSPYETDVGNYISARPEPIRKQDGTLNYGWCIEDVINAPFRAVLKTALDYVEKDDLGKLPPITRATVLWYAIVWKDELRKP